MTFDPNHEPQPPVGNPPKYPPEDIGGSALAAASHMIDGNAERANIYGALTRLIGPDSTAGQRFIAKKKEELIELSHIQPVTLDEVQRLMKEVDRRYDTTDMTMDQYQDELKKLETRYVQSQAATNADKSIESFESHPTIKINAYEIDMPSLQHLFLAAPSMHPNHAFDDAPFADFKDNSDEAWKHVSDTDVRRYLTNKTFIETEGLSDDTANQLSVTTIEGTDPDGQPAPVEIPLKFMVHAYEFGSWQGKNDRDTGEEGMRVRSLTSKKFGHTQATSIDVMKAYASETTELPAVGLVNLYVQPDGKIFGDNHDGDSHRIGAAMLRGQKSIKAHSVNIIMLKSNVL